MKKTFIIVTAILIATSCDDLEQSNGLISRIEDKLDEAITEFEPTNSSFLFTVFHNDTAIVQIVHRSVIEQTRHDNDEFGLAINLPFDPSFESELYHHDKFKKLNLSKSFTYYEWDGIPIYALDLGLDTKKSARIITQLLSEVYGYDLRSNFEMELLDQSK